MKHSRNIDSNLHLEDAMGLSKIVRSESGISLVIVLWVLALLIIIVTEFAFTMRVESSATRNFKDAMAAHGLAVAGINMGLAEVAEAYNFVGVDEKGRLVFIKNTDGVLRNMKADRDFDLGEGRVSYAVEDELGKLNINTATRDMVASLLKDTGVDDTVRDVIADSIMDWRDANHEFHLNGAEDDHYENLPYPYEAKDGLFDFTEELLLVRGVTPEIFFGSGMLPPEFGLGDTPSGGAVASNLSGVARHLTVRGDGKININSADEEVLTAAFGKGRAAEILLRRSMDFFTIPAYGGVLSSGVFSIRSKGEVRGIRVGIKVIAERRAGSPSVAISYWNEEGVISD